MPRDTQHLPDETKAALRALAKIGTVHMPDEAEEPILAPAVRQAVFAWLYEINATDELKAVGLKPRRSALLYGPPGCGKTTLAHHLAARLGIPMVVVGSESIVTAYLGESSQNIAKLFDALAKIETPVLLFLDEIDAIGSRRKDERGGGAQDERNAMLTVLMRKLEVSTCFTVAATNRADALDPALWRRFDMQISVDLPTEDERFAILRRYSAPFRLAETAVDTLTAQTMGASPALLRGLMESMKRALILGPRIHQPTGDPVALFARLAAAIAPPPEIEPPPLWETKAAGLAGIPWPPTREESEEKS